VIEINFNPRPEKKDYSEQSKDEIFLELSSYFKKQYIDLVNNILPYDKYVDNVKEKIKITEEFDEHPDWYNDECCCKTCCYSAI